MVDGPHGKTLHDGHTPMLNVSPEILRDLETELNEPRFLDVPLGFTLNDLMYLYLHLGKLPDSAFEVNKQRLRYLCRQVRMLPYSAPRGNEVSQPILLTWIKESPVFKELVLPVVDALPKGEALILGYHSQMASELRAEVPFLSLTEASAVSRNEWKVAYRECAQQWHRKLRSFVKKHNLPEASYHYVAYALLIHSQRVVAFRRFLAGLKPRAVVTEFDRNAWAACLILTARSLGIPTMTMIHGVINAYGYTPILADVAFCWGERQKQQLIDLGVEREQLVVTGCPRLRRDAPINAESAKHRLGAAPEKLLILLGTNPIRRDLRLKLAEVFCEGLSRVPYVSAAVRLHSSEKIEEYDSLQKKYPAVLFHENAAHSLNEILAAADLVVVHHSGLGNDALVKGKLTMVLDVLPFPLGNGGELIEQAGAPRLASSQELSDAVQRFVQDEVWRKQLQEKAEVYVDQFCAAFGNEAVSNIVREIRKRTHLGPRYGEKRFEKAMMDQ